MKIADAIGFTAAVAAGGYYGYQASDAIHAGTLQYGIMPPYFTWMDWLIIVGLLAVAWYFAVILS